MTSGIIKQHKKFERPLRLFETERIAKENEFMEKYGLKNKREIWKINFAVKKIRNQAKGLITASSEEQEAFIGRLARKGLLKVNAKMDDVLGMTIDKFVERRLQTVVLRKGLARSAKEARQMITHRKIMVGERIVNVPSYFVNIEEERIIKLSPRKEKPKKEAIAISGGENVTA